jgi:hypothetical protein
MASSSESVLESRAELTISLSRPPSSSRRTASAITSVRGLPRRAARSSSRASSSSFNSIFKVPIGPASSLAGYRSRPSRIEAQARHVTPSGIRVTGRTRPGDLDTRESRELDELIREVDLAFGAVMRAPAPRQPDTGDGGTGRASSSAWPRPASSGTPAGAATSTGQAREVFDHWVEAGCPTWLPSRVETSGLAADELLGQLSDEPAPLPAQITRALGQLSPCSYARGSWLLVWARHATDGPRCRSYRAARYFLADADPDALPAASTALTHHRAGQPARAHPAPRSPT